MRVRALTAATLCSALLVAACASSPVPAGTAGAVDEAHHARGAGANGRSDRNARVGRSEDNGRNGRSGDGTGWQDGCPQGMANVEGRFCVDRWEASLVEILPNGEERAWSPYYPVEHHVVRAVSVPHVYPQGYVSEVQSQRACERSGKRLCRPAEWKKACMGPSNTTFPYGSNDEPGRCNDHGKNPTTGYDWERMNRPSLNQTEGTLAKTGDHSGCTNGYGVYDMVGNLHEWVADPEGTFQGGFYQDTHQHGDGCTYVTTAHVASYHDYSTGFRCCADVTAY